MFTLSNQDNCALSRHISTKIRTLSLSTCLRPSILRLLLLHCDWSQQCSADTEVGHKGTENKKRPTPRQQINEQLHSRSQNERPDAAARHGDAVCQGLPAPEVAADHGDGWSVAEGKSKTWKGKSD